MVRNAVAFGSMLCTGEHAFYTETPEYTHHVVNHSAKQFVDGMAHTNGIESVWAVLKRGFYGVYHSFSEKHLQRYVNEFAYRLNEGNVRVHTMDRIDATGKSQRKTNDLQSVDRLKSQNNLTLMKHTHND